MKLHYKKNVLSGFFLALAIIASLGVYSYLSIEKLINSAQLLNHSSQVISSAEEVLSITIDVETAARGYVITGDRSYLEPYDSAMIQIDNQISELKAATSSDPEQSSRVEKLDHLIHKKTQISGSIIKARERSFAEAQDLIVAGHGKKVMDDIRDLILEVQQTERELFKRQNFATAESLQQFQISFLALLIAPAVIIILLFYSINRQLDARVRVERQLRKASYEISHLNKELEAYTYSVSHDLRAPLRSIDGYSGILKEDYASHLDDEGKRVIEIIIKNARRMGQLIDDLLDFSRIGRRQISRIPVNMEEMVRNILHEVIENQNGRQMDISIRTLEPAQADANMVQQVWTNLISNAIKYSSKKEETRIEIGSYSNADEVTYFIKDNGAGFNMDYKHKLFGVFQRLHKLTEFEGTGVGLALVKRIVTRHGGNVWAESKLGEGATFFFTLPKIYKEEKLSLVLEKETEAEVN